MELELLLNVSICGQSTSSRRFWSRGPGTGFEPPMETENCRQQKSLGEEDEELSVLDEEISQAEGSSSDESDSDQEMKEKGGESDPIDL